MKETRGQGGLIFEAFVKTAEETWQHGVQITQGACMFRKMRTARIQVVVVTLLSLVGGINRGCRSPVESAGHGHQLGVSIGRKMLIYSTNIVLPTEHRGL
jgi:hypothetical protein